MKLKEIMTDDVICVSKNTTISEAAKLMKIHDIGSIPVCDNERLVGIITDRDIVIRGIANNTDITNKRCNDVMTNNIEWASSDMDVHKAAEIMSCNQIRRLPVVDNGKLVGIVSLGDLALESKLIDEAGDTLNNISKPDIPNMK